MSDQFLGEIRMFGGNFAINGFALCNGQILAIAQNTALFSLLGTQFGGNGMSNFALPNLQGMFPMNYGNGAGLTPRVIGEQGGSATVTLTTAQMPAHSHAPQCASGGGNTDDPTHDIWAMGHSGKAPIKAYSTTGMATNAAMNANAIGLTGGSQAHNNLPPFLVLNFIIAMVGIYPARS